MVLVNQLDELVPRKPAGLLSSDGGYEAKWTEHLYAR